MHCCWAQNIHQNVQIFSNTSQQIISMVQISPPREENNDQIPEGGEIKIDQFPHICPTSPHWGVHRRCIITLSQMLLLCLSPTLHRQYFAKAKNYIVFCDQSYGLIWNHLRKSILYKWFITWKRSRRQLVNRTVLFWENGIGRKRDDKITTGRSTCVLPR